MGHAMCEYYTKYNSAVDVMALPLAELTCKDAKPKEWKFRHWDNGKSYQHNLACKTQGVEIPSLGRWKII